MRLWYDVCFGYAKLKRGEEEEINEDCVGGGPIKNKNKRNVQNGK